MLLPRKTPLARGAWALYRKVEDENSLRQGWWLMFNQKGLWFYLKLLTEEAFFMLLRCCQLQRTAKGEWCSAGICFVSLQNPSRWVRRVFGKYLPSRKINAFAVGETEADTLQIFLQTSLMPSCPFQKEHSSASAGWAKQKPSIVKRQKYSTLKLLNLLPAATQAFCLFF